MENTIDDGFQDALSFCDLSFEDAETQINDNHIIKIDRQTSLSSQDFFEFSTSSLSSDSNSNIEDDIVFCGKVISSKSNQSRNSLSLSSSSAKNNKLQPALPPARTLRCSSSNAASRKHKVMIGLAKIPSKMELNDLRERQNRNRRIPPPPMFPASPLKTADNGNRRKSNWSLLKSFRYKSNGIGSFLPKPCFGSILLARPCID